MNYLYVNYKRSVLFSILILLINSAYAEPEPVKEKIEKSVEAAAEVVKKATQKVEQEVSVSRLKRDEKKYFVIGTYSPIDLIIPSKIGLSAGLNKSAARSLELEYLRGLVSVPFLVEDLGSMTDQRLSLIWRSYGASNSFNFSFGFSYFDYKLKLGSEILNRVTGGATPSIDLISIQALGANIGLGNRWTFKNNFSFGVDWISLSQPLYVLKTKDAFLDYATDANDRDDVDDLIKAISYFPRLTVAKLQIGYSF